MKRGNEKRNEKRTQLVSVDRAGTGHTSTHSRAARQALMASPATSTTAPWPRTWDLSLKLDIPAETKAVVEKARKEIDDLLAKRGKK